VQKNAKKRKMQSVPKTPEILVLSKIGLWRFVEALKSVEDTEIPDTSVHTFQIPQGHFQGFQDFQLRIEVKFRKKATFFWKNFHFLRFTGWRSVFFTWGENLNFAFFEKCGTRFRFWVRFCAALLEKIRPDENDDAYRLL
jgi:hypothetical protein